MDNKDNEQPAEEKSKVVLDEKSKIMEKGECLRAMMFDLIERMVKEGEGTSHVRCGQFFTCRTCYGHNE